MDREDSFPDQSCPLGNHSGPDTSSHWEGMCSSASACSQSSDDEMKPLGHSKAELYPSVDNTDDYPPAVVSLLPPSGPSAGMGSPLDRGSHQYTGKERLRYRYTVLRMNLLRSVDCTMF